MPGKGAGPRGQPASLSFQRHAELGMKEIEGRVGRAQRRLARRRRSRADEAVVDAGNVNRLDRSTGPAERRLAEMRLLDRHGPVAFAVNEEEGGVVRSDIGYRADRRD